MNVADVFRHDIRRRIEEVIKVDFGDEAAVARELDEYVVTDHLRQAIEEILDRYQETINTPDEGVTVWVSGFFGSGRSSLAKNVGYLLDNPVVAGMPAAERLIYWYLSVPSRQWGLWLYAPRLSREVLYAVGREARRRLHTAGETGERIRADQARLSGKALAGLDRDLAATDQLVDELRAFAVEAERVAGLGWEPDLDDGMVLCAAPLAGLFPAWPEVAKERIKLKVGEYPWSAVARWAEAL